MKEEFEEWMAIATYYNGRHVERRRVEVQMLYTALGLYGLAVGTVLGLGTTLPDPVRILGSLVLVVVAILTLWHLANIHMANHDDMHAANDAMKQARSRLTGAEAPQSTTRPMRIQALHTGNFPVQLGTILAFLLAAVTVLWTYSPTPHG